jgi:hypothetical protein
MRFLSKPRLVHSDAVRKQFPKMPKLPGKPHRKCTGVLQDCVDLIIAFMALNILFLSTARHDDLYYLALHLQLKFSPLSGALLALAS